MTLYEFQNRINLIRDFIIKMNKETIPHPIQKIIIKLYANTLRISLTETMIDQMI